MVRGRTRPSPKRQSRVEDRERRDEDVRRRAETAPISPAQKLVTADPRPAGEDEKRKEGKKPTDARFQVTVAYLRMLVTDFRNPLQDT